MNCGQVRNFKGGRSTVFKENKRKMFFSHSFLGKHCMRVFEEMTCCHCSVETVVYLTSQFLRQPEIAEKG
ncbi:hypothetical protein EXN66_Car011285 [Channa argus]|uniref:Uncharacterized protein n=1 Tax=Channa argus TaxID=215402 RepID=A0A6G1PZF4_CHAAH|nr:hypothetical protein EXN66_Car011285 [Channa argus]